MNRVAILVMMFGVVLLSGFIGEKAHAAETLEVGESRSLGTKVEVPVTLRDTMYLSSGNFVITAPVNQGVMLKDFRPTPAFDDKIFRTKWSVVNNKLDLNFVPISGKEERLVDKKITIGYLVYELSDEFTEGESVELSIISVNMKGRLNTDFLVTLMNGKIERKMPIGDVVGNNKPTAAAAIRILQHLNNPITDREAFLSADVNGDGVLTQEDAQWILDYVAGKRTTFLAIQAKELDNAVLKSEYSDQVSALNGRAPYTFKRVGSLPSGMLLDENTGKISGTPTRAGSYTFTIQVTDAVGDIEKRIFSIDVIDSNILSVEKLLPINVKLHGTPELPAKVNVTYKDKTTGIESVTWQPVDTSKIGTFIAKGTIGNSGFTVSVEVNVVSTNYLNSIKVAYVQFLNLHTIEVDVSADVYKVTVNSTYNMHFEGDKKFSLISSSFKANSTVTFRLYDKYGNLLETKQHVLKPN
ncbi:putative Ig domain-containing protein [Sporosarcina sp. GW1-11]|uniref:putative Ig domain-containing protein n=1 Tax=Sporosarcina sp. GW1-11 TaxID=2899126 RepID=UPI002954B920|nr:putative Ig domain-containing protein [Sporosarcina sp. GW1-11]